MASMRITLAPQVPFEFGESHLHATRTYYPKYSAINEILQRNRENLGAFQKDAVGSLRMAAQNNRAHNRRASPHTAWLLP